MITAIENLDNITDERDNPLVNIITSVPLEYSFDKILQKQLELNSLQVQKYCQKTVSKNLKQLVQ